MEDENQRFVRWLVQHAKDVDEAVSWAEKEHQQHEVTDTEARIRRAGFYLVRGGTSVLAAFGAWVGWHRKALANTAVSVGCGGVLLVTPPGDPSLTPGVVPDSTLTGPVTEQSVDPEPRTLEPPSRTAEAGGRARDGLGESTSRSAGQEGECCPPAYANTGAVQDRENVPAVPEAVIDGDADKGSTDTGNENVTQTPSESSEPSPTSETPTEDESQPTPDREGSEQNGPPQSQPPETRPPQGGSSDDSAPTPSPGEGEEDGDSGEDGEEGHGDDRDRGGGNDDADNPAPPHNGRDCDVRVKVEDVADACASVSRR